MQGLCSAGSGQQLLRRPVPILHCVPAAHRLASSADNAGADGARGSRRHPRASAACLQHAPLKIPPLPGAPVALSFTSRPGQTMMEGKRFKTTWDHNKMVDFHIKASSVAVVCVRVWMDGVHVWIGARKGETRLLHASPLLLEPPVQTLVCPGPGFCHAGGGQRAETAQDGAQACCGPQPHNNHAQGEESGLAENPATWMHSRCVLLLLLPLPPPLVRLPTSSQAMPPSSPQHSTLPLPGIPLRYRPLTCLPSLAARTQTPLCSFYLGVTGTGAHWSTARYRAPSAHACLSLRRWIT